MKLHSFLSKFCLFSTMKIDTIDHLTILDKQFTWLLPWRILTLRAGNTKPNLIFRPLHFFISLPSIYLWHSLHILQLVDFIYVHLRSQLLLQLNQVTNTPFIHNHLPISLFWLSPTLLALTPNLIRGDENIVQQPVLLYHGIYDHLQEHVVHTFVTDFCEGFIQVTWDCSNVWD